MAKGGQYEREVCYALSKWWTGKDDESVFWRSSQSGGRATVRGRKGKSTAGHYGDICATDPVAHPLMKVVTIEVKRGYNKDSLFNLLDKLPNRKRSGFEDWLNQARASAMQAGSPYWMIIAKRSGKQAMVFFPRTLLHQLQGRGSITKTPRPFIAVNMWLLTDNKTKVKIEFVGMLFEEFLSRTSASDFKHLAATM